MDENKLTSALLTVLEMAQYRLLHWQEASEMGLEVDAYELLPAIMESSPWERKNLTKILKSEVNIVEKHESLFTAAPELLKACKVGYNYLHHCDCEGVQAQPDCEGALCTFCIFKNAIAKAEEKMC